MKTSILTQDNDVCIMNEVRADLEPPYEFYVMPESEKDWWAELCKIILSF